MNRNIMIASVAVIALFFPVRESSAGLSDILSRAAGWWNARSVSVSDVSGHGSRLPADGLAAGVTGHDSKVGEDPAVEEDAKNPAAPATGRVPGMCQVPREPQKIICEAGSGFLCVSTPPGGVAGDALILRGTIDRKNSSVASVKISAQNEYSKKTVPVDTSDPSDANCKSGEPKGSFCLDKDGFFAARVLLSEKGPYTISVSASRLSGESAEKRVRTSRVVMPKLSEKGILFDPDVRRVQSVDGQSVSVTVDLLGDCKFCDFIGSSTGGVTVSVENTIKEPKGATRHISCLSTVEQGGQGKFMIGVPVGSGSNTLAVKVCNAAASGGQCPGVGGVSFTGSGDVAALEILSPPPLPVYAQKEYPGINWKFKLGKGAECAKVQFNRDAPAEVCPDGAGVFNMELHPRAGINVATVEGSGGGEYAWTFGWGDVQSPFGKNDGIIEIPQAAGITLPARTVKDIIVPLVNNFLQSDELGKMIENLFKGGPAPKSSGGEQRTIDIPHCDTGGGLKGFMMSVRGKPKIKSAEIGNLSFETDKASLSVTLKGLNAGINLTPDENGDGKGDAPPLPLVFAVKKAVLNLTLEVKDDGDGNSLIIIGSPDDDCRFKLGSYCKHMPAALIPQNIEGDARPWGVFIACDEDVAEGEAKVTCRDLNSLNAQTGIVAEKVLDAINNSIYCGGSAALTSLSRGTNGPIDIELGCKDPANCGNLMKAMAPVKLPLTAGFENGLSITPSGIELEASLLVGKKDLYNDTPSQYRIASSGLISDGSPGGFAMAGADAPGGDAGVALSLDALNSILYAATVQGDGRKSKGLLDFDISEDFFNSLGFDFVKECDAFEPPDDPNAGEAEKKPPALCSIRPRVMELLGASLSTYGYFDAKQPLLLAIRGNRALAPRLSIKTLNKLPVVPREDEGKSSNTGIADSPKGSLVELEIGGATISFYALEIDDQVPADEHGNLFAKKDADGRPLIKSMRPEDPDPWNGPIVSFDLTLLLSLEVDTKATDPKDETVSAIMVRPLAERSRLVITPIEGSNSTTVPAPGIIISLYQQLNYVLADSSSLEKAFYIPVPKEMALAAADFGGLFSSLGLKEISFGEGGLAIDFDPAENSVKLAIDAVITQLLHEGGKEVTFTVPPN